MKDSIIVASDHAGYEMKKELVKYLKSKGYKTDDVGTYSSEPVDYPDYGHLLGRSIESGEYKRGISICGSGNGINMVSNKHRGVRAAICWSEEISEMARRHNDANVCSLPARYINTETAKKIVDIFLNTGFDGGRHARRIKKIDI